MNFIRSVICQDESISASDVKTYDLPVNPLSHVELTLRGYNVTDEATLAEVVARISKVEILHLGAAIFSMSGADLYAFQGAILSSRAILRNRIATDNYHRILSMIIPLGRKIMDPDECFPGTKKGELKIQITFSGTETAIDNLSLQVETTEILGATPSHYLKATTLSKTAAAAGEIDVDLPIGNPLVGILLYGTTIPAAEVYTTTVDYVKLLFDNVEKGYSKSNWESLSGDLALKCGADAITAAAAGESELAHYALMDFDPNKDNNFLLDTAPASSVKLRIYAGDTNAMRIIPIELVAVK